METIGRRGSEVSQEGLGLRVPFKAPFRVPFKRAGA